MKIVKEPPGSSFSTPPCCCRCTGVADTVRTFRGSGRGQFLNFDLPICKSCNRLLGRRYGVLIVALLATIGIALLLSELIQPFPNWLIGVIVFAILALLLGLVAVLAYEPASYRLGVFTFRNDVFGEAFARLNGVTADDKK